MQPDMVSAARHIIAIARKAEPEFEGEVYALIITLSLRAKTRKGLVPQMSS